MAQRTKVSAAPVKKMRKNHGPKRFLFHGYSKACRIDLGKNSNILTKYYNEESFALACYARGVKNFISELWRDFSVLPTIKAKDEFLVNLKTHFDEASARVQKRAKK